MRPAPVICLVVFLFNANAAFAQGNDLESRVQELEAALDLLQDRIERLEAQQAPRRVSEDEARAVLHKKQVEQACAAELGPAPEFAEPLSTKVNPEFVAYNKKLRACMREQGVQ